VVLSGASRESAAARELIAADLARWGVTAARWTTTAELPGGRGAQILDFITRHLGNDMSVAVVDTEPLGSEDGTMMQMMLRQQLVKVAPRGLGREEARRALALLAGENE
jgi:hypothetical protein